MDKQNFESKSGALMKKLEVFLAKLDKELEEQNFICGNSVRLCDFYLYEFLEAAYLVHPGAKSMFKNLANARSKFEHLDGIKEYLQSSKYNSKLFPPSMAAVNTWYVYFLKFSLSAQVNKILENETSLVSGHSVLRLRY